MFCTNISLRTKYTLRISNLKTHTHINTMCTHCKCQQTQVAYRHKTVKIDGIPANKQHSLRTPGTALPSQTTMQTGPPLPPSGVRMNSYQVPLLCGDPVLLLQLVSELVDSSLQLVGGIGQNSLTPEDVKWHLLALGLNGANWRTCVSQHRQRQRANHCPVIWCSPLWMRRDI